MVVVGADVHKSTHTFVAVDQVGRRLGQLKVEATTAGHLKALVWARREFGDELTWAIEDCRHLSARLERVSVRVSAPHWLRWLDPDHLVPGSYGGCRLRADRHAFCRRQV